MERDDKHLIFVKISDAIVPPNGLIEHIANRRWSFDKERGLICYQHLPKDVPSAQWATIKFVPSVFRRIKPQDYV